MACSQTRQLAGQMWPLHRTTPAGLCCYRIEVDSAAEAAAVIADAQTQPDYVKQSRFYSVPGNRIRFYVYFTGV